MDNQGDLEEEIHPGSSSSSSSPPSSHSSSSSSSSSPSHPQSFASSRSSQKELSAPSSSHSSSSSSSPFSGPSSPAHAANIEASSSASEELQIHGSNDSAALFASDTTTLPSIPAEGGPTDECNTGSSNKQDPLCTDEVIEEFEINLGNSTSRIEQPSLGSSVVTANDICGGVPEEVSQYDHSQIPDIDFNVDLFNIASTLESTQAFVACNGSVSAPDDIPLELRAARSNPSDRGCNPNSKVDDCAGSSRQQDTLLKDESRQTNTTSPSCSGRAEMSNNTIGLHDDLDTLRDCGSLYAPCYLEQVSQTKASPPHGLEPDANISYNAMEPVETLVLPSKTPSTSPTRDEACKPALTKTTNMSFRRFQGGSPDINKLPRARTMPSGSLEVVNGEVRPSRSIPFKRVNTEKLKSPTRTPGPKISKRKQKKLMKKMCTLQKDGTVELDLERSKRFAPGIFEPDDWEDYDGTIGDEGDRPPLDIAMLIVGTRGDVQPFVAIGKRLQEHGHRVRLATHSNFEEFVLKAGLEFYPLGGDPKVLAEYMVKNKGFLPSGPSEIRTQKKQMKSIINSLLPACTQPDKFGVKFKVQAIIANPPAYGHADVAEALKVPLHIFFTMPWTPTSEFPHPLARVGHFAANRVSYQAVDSLIWLGIRGIINDFRKKKLRLRPITYLGVSQQSVSKLPTGYIWSPHLVPKPKDWGLQIDVVGFCFLNLSQDYKPPDQLVKWLAAGLPPIYIGFGSLPVEDPSGMTKIILNALTETSQRGIIDKGWGGIGTMVDLPESVYLLDNCPHDWLFSQCAAVVHHGGAGTTAAGLKAACPTTIVPFFGDQAFWGDRVHARGVGPPPIPVDQFSLDKLVSAIRFMLNTEVKERAMSLAEAMKGEDGVEGAVKAFHRHLPREMPLAPASLPSKKPHCCLRSFHRHLPQKMSLAPAPLPSKKRHDRPWSCCMGL